MKSFLLAALLLLVGVPALAGEKKAAPPPPQTHCPISGRPVGGDSFADVEGFRVLTAGTAEADEVRRNPRKAFAWLAKNRQAAVPVVWVCPSMRQQVTPEYPFVQQAGKRIYFCCGPCQPKISKNFKGAADVMRQLAGQ